MKILIDLQACQTASRNRGIGRYSLALAKAIARNRREHDVHILANGNFETSSLELRAEFRHLIPATNVHVFECPPFDAMDSAAWNFQSAHHIREAFIETIQPDLVHVSSLFEWWDVPVSLPKHKSKYFCSVTLYDLIPLSRPDTLPRVPHARKWYQEQTAQLKTADCILAISENAREHALSCLSINADKIVNISGGVSEALFSYPLELQTQKLDFLRKKNIHREFVLCVGVIEERKNIERLIDAWALLPAELRNCHQLVLAASAFCDKTLPKIDNAIQRHQLSCEDVVILKGCSDAELQILYRSCKLFILPSMHEGFGLPAAEAMVCGAPTIGSNTTSIPEVIGLESALFDPYDTQRVNEKLLKCLSDDDFLSFLKKHALEHSKTFSWDAVAARALAAFERSIVSRSIDPKRPMSDESYRALSIDRLKASKGRPSSQCILQAAKSIAANRPRNNRQLLIDVTVLAESDAGTGVQRVVRNYSKQLLKASPSGFEVRLIRCRGKTWHYATDLQTKLTESNDRNLVIKESAVEVFCGDVFLGADLGLHYIPLQRYWLEKAKSRGVTINFIVYDLLPILRPEFFHEGISGHFAPWLTFVGELADQLICISETVALEAQSFYSQRKLTRSDVPVISYVHMGADLDTSGKAHRQTQNQSDFGATTSSTFLIVSTVEPRKGHEQLLGAFEILWNRGVDTKLVIIGKSGWNVETLIRRIQTHPQLGKKLVWLNNASDEILDSCYESATALISASFGEGFGLPLIEGAQRKLPIIARDIPVFREIAKDHAYFFASKNPIGLADSIQDWLDLYSQNKHPKSDSLPWKSWPESTEDLKLKLGI